MANDTVPMPEMFEACYQVLTRKLIPIHYAELTKLALESLGLSDKDVHWQRQIEDVREKMLLAGFRDSFYVGYPYCLGGLGWWFQTTQLRLLHPTFGISIPGSVSSGIRGAFEALMRDPYLKIKEFPDSLCPGCGHHRRPAGYEQVAKGRASGFVIEKHVADWFKLNWPEFYLPPDNKGNWRVYCPHDFKLKVDDRLCEVDVAGPKQNGQFSNPGKGKKRVDFHLICDIMDKDVIWKSALVGSKFEGIVYPESDGIYPERMVVWLNCKRDGIDYDAIKQTLSTTSQITKAA